MYVLIWQSCNGVYLNGQRIDPDKWVEIKVKDQLCFGTPISNNSFRYVLKLLTNGEYQLVREGSIIEEELPGTIKKKPNEIGVADTSEAGTVDGKKESTSNVSNTSNPSEEAGGSSSTDETRQNEMLSSMQEEFLCVICQELFVKAHSLSCSHSYCEQCITDWMKTNKYCPMCRKTIEGKPVPSIAMDNAITKLVECLSDEAQKERAELLKERSSAKLKKDVIVISDSPARPSTSGVVTRSASRRAIPVNLVSSDSDSELSSSDSDSDPEEYDEYRDDFDDPDYTGLPGYNWGGYGRCYRCGECLHEQSFIALLVHSTGDPGHWAPGCPN